MNSEVGVELLNDTCCDRAIVYDETRYRYRNNKQRRYREYSIISNRGAQCANVELLPCTPGFCNAVEHAIHRVIAESDHGSCSIADSFDGLCNFKIRLY